MLKINRSFNYIANIDIFLELRVELEEFRLELDSNGEVPISKKLCPPSNEPTIPKIFHQIWLDFGHGSEPSDEYRNLTERLISLHPNWRHILWREEEIIGLINEHVPFFLQTFIFYNVPVKKHDSARMVILYAMGGVYLDSDFFPLKRIEPALGTCKFIVGNKYEKEFRPLNGLIGSVAKNPFLLFVLNAMNAPGVSRKRVLDSTGPTLLTKLMKEFVKNEKPELYRIYHPKFFYPLDWQIAAKEVKKYNTAAKLQSHFPDCFFLQLFHASWVSSKNTKKYPLMLTSTFSFRVFDSSFS